MDKRALKILFDFYWSPNGWKEERKRKISSDEFAYANAAGIMFDPIQVGHGVVLNRLFQARNAITAQHVADGFLASLSSRRLDLRSALGSFAVFRHFPAHESQGGKPQCGLCGLDTEPDDKEDISVLNFERFKWGGVRHDDPLYAAIDLDLFLREEQIQPSREDIDIFGKLIVAIESAPEKTTAATLQRHLSGVLKSNKDERDALIAILGFCGILETPNHEGYRNRFVPMAERELPNHRFVDMPYPACWWSSKNGVNRNALDEWFGHVI